MLMEHRPQTIDAFLVQSSLISSVLAISLAAYLSI